MRDPSEGKQGASYALTTSVLDTAAGASATAMATLATIGKVARPSLSLAAGGLTILSVAAHLGPVLYSTTEKTGVIQSARIQTGTPAGRFAIEAARGLPTNNTQAAISQTGAVVV